MFHIRHKAVGGQKIPDERVSGRHRTLDHGPARQTDEVEVIRMIGEVIGRRAVVEMGVRDHSHVLKRLEVAIDGGQ